MSTPDRGRGSAFLVAVGILLSRFAGLLRQASVGYFFGAGPHADVFIFALRGPNILQNLLGEQTLSASFIPIYSRQVEEGRDEEAGRFAGAVFGLLLVVAASIALLGILLAEPIVTLLAPGFLTDAAKVAAGEASVDRYLLAVRAVRWIFPMTGFLVLSAWALGILNSHRRFLLPYVAPVAWNAAIIAALWLAGSLFLGGAFEGSASLPPSSLDRVLMAAFVGALGGGLLQLLVQLPLVVRLLRGFRLSISTRVAGVQEALRAFAPLAMGRGVVQLSSYLDLVLASLLAAGAPAALGYAQTLYLLPISVFGMSVAAAELPEIARRTRPDQEGEVAERLERGLRQSAFLTLPTFVGYLAFGFLIVGGLYRRGSFGWADNWLVYLVLAAYTIGLPATNVSRLLNNVFYATGRTRVPARIAVERVALSALLGVGLMIWLDRYQVAAVFGLPPGQRELYLGAMGLAGGAGVAAWYELWRLRRALARDLPGARIPWRRLGKLVGVALVAVVPALLVWRLVRSLLELPAGLGTVVELAMVMGVFIFGYLALTKRMGISEIGNWLGRRSNG